MKNFTLLVMLVSLFTLKPTESYGFGIGLILSGESGISFKTARYGRDLYDGAVFLGEENTVVQLHKIVHKSRLVYYGYGARFSLDALNSDNNQKNMINGGTLFGLKGKKDKKEADTEDSAGAGVSDLLSEFTLRFPIGVRKSISGIEVFGELALLVSIGAESNNTGTEFIYGARMYL